MAIESPDELMAFFSADEFAESATILNIAGSHPITGNFDTMADVQRPGGTTNSSRSPFITGAAEFSVYDLQYTTDWWRVQAAQTAQEDVLDVATGSRHAGQYRIKDIQRDGDIVRLMLNRL